MDTSKFSADQYQVSILIGIHRRSGTNYLSKLMSYHTDIRHIPPNTTSGEIGLMTGMNEWKEAVRIFDQHFVSPGVTKKTIRFEDFAKYLGKSWLDYLVTRFKVPPGYLFLKEPCTLGLENFFDLFPSAKLLLLIRDGRDAAASYMKAALARRRTTTRAHLTIAYLNHFFWRDYILFLKNWATAASRILAFDKQYKDTSQKSRYLILRYEDVYQNTKEKMAEVFSFLGLDYNDSLLNQLTEAEVVGSSFFSPHQKENAKKLNWIPTPKSEHFKPLGRWQEWSSARKAVFKRIAGQSLIDFGYEKDLSW